MQWLTLGIHFPRLTKSANCSQHPGADTKKGDKFEHLVPHMEKFNQEQDNNILIGRTRKNKSEGQS
jgi:hypothetical protein